MHSREKLEYVPHNSNAYSLGSLKTLERAGEKALNTRKYGGEL